MGLLNWILPVRHDVLELARRVATESRGMVWQLIAPRAGLLTSLCEAQGYIHARATSVVRSRLPGAVGPHKLSAEHRRQILALALDLVVAQFTGPMLHAQQQRPAA